MPYIRHRNTQEGSGQNSSTHFFKFGAGLGSTLPRVTIIIQYLFGHTDNRILLYLAFRTINRTVVWVFVDYHGQLLVIECKAVAKVSLRKQSLYIRASHQSHQFCWSLQQFIARV